MIAKNGNLKFKHVFGKKKIEKKWRQGLNISNKISTFALVIIQELLRQAKANEFRPMRKDAGVAERGGLENR